MRLLCSGLFNNVEFLLEAGGEWGAYNSDKKVLRDIEYYASFNFDDVFKYTENQLMLLVTGSKLVNWSDYENI